MVSELCERTDKHTNHNTLRLSPGAKKYIIVKIYPLIVNFIRVCRIITFWFHKVKCLQLAGEVGKFVSCSVSNYLEILGTNIIKIR